MNNDNIDDFLNELYDNWIDIVIDNVPLVNNFNRRNILQERFNSLINGNNTMHFYRNYQFNNNSTNISTSNIQSVNDFVNFVNNTERNNVIQQRTQQIPEIMSTVNLRNQIPGRRPDISNLLGDLLGNIVDYIAEPEFQDVKVTITEKDFDNLQSIKISHDNINEYIDKECNICLENYVEDDNLTVLPCKHFFHSDCIHDWLCNEKVNCPICRKDIRDS